MECLINNNFMYIYYKGNQNFEQKSIFSNFLKKKVQIIYYQLKFLEKFSSNSIKVKKIQKLIII